MTHRKNLDERSERVVTTKVQMRLGFIRLRPTWKLPTDENEKLKDDGSDLETIREDMEVPEPVPQRKHK